MLRINLLPDYVRQRRFSKRVVVGFSALFVILGAALGVYYVSASSAAKAELQKAEYVEGQKAITDNLTQQAQTVSQSAQPLEAKVDFVTQVHKYNLWWANLYAGMAHYTLPGIILSDASVSDSVMTMKCYTPSFRSLMAYLVRIRKDPEFSQVTVDNVPSYQNAYTDVYTYKNYIVSIGSPPGGQSGTGQGGYPGSGGFSGVSSRGGYPGGGGGYPGGGGGYPGSAGATGGGYPGGGGRGGQGSGGYGQTTLNSVLQFFGVVTPLDKIIQDNISPLALPREAEEYAEQVRQGVKMKKVPSGFFFTATATINDMPALPTVPTSGGSSTGGGAPGMGGGAPGMGGGYPGMGGGYPGAGGRGGYPGGPMRTASNG